MKNRKLFVLIAVTLIALYLCWLMLQPFVGVVAWAGVFIIGTVDNFLRPKLVKQKARLHELLIFFSVLGGLQLYGVLGIVLGPLTVAITLALIEILRESNDGEENDELRIRESDY